jgi:Bacterial Ig domain
VSTGTQEGMGAGLLALTDPTGAPASTLGIPAFVWLSEQGVEVRFASALGEPAGNDGEALGRVLVGAGEGKSALQMASAGDAVGVAWQEVSASGYSIIKLRGVSQDVGLLGAEITIGGVASDLSHHSLAMSGYALDLANGAGGASSGLNLVWVASDAWDPPGIGRIMMQRFHLHRGEDGTPPQLIPVDLLGPALHRISNNSGLETGLAGAANDNSMWIGDEDGAGGAVGRQPSVATLDTGDVLVAWIGSEGHVHGKLYATAEAGPASSQTYAAVNEALADLTPHLGREGDGQGFDARRVKVNDLGPGNFALVWLVAAGADAMLHGSIFSLHADEPSGGGPGGDWAQTPIAPVALPAGFTGEFNLAVADGASSEFVLSYEVADSAGNVTLAAVAQNISPVETALGGKEAAADAAGGTDKADLGMPLNKVAFNGGPGNPFLAPEQHDSISVNTASLAPAEPEATGTEHTETTARDAAETASDLIVAANSDGIAAAWMVMGSADDEVGVRVRIYNDTEASTGADEGAVIDVTDHADASVAPAVVRIGDGGAVVAWVDKPTGELRAQSYTSRGEPQGGHDGIAVAAGHKVSDLALASNSARQHTAGANAQGHAETGADYDVEFAMAWVVDAKGDGYGNIMLQRYLVRSNSDGGADQAPVALGRDGQIGGDSDTPEPFSVDGEAGPVSVIGRAPQLAGLAQGQLAMSWVANDGAQETVKGVVLERDGGRIILNIDLSEQLDVPAVVAKGTHPILTSDANGDMLVAWLEPDGSGAFDIKAALYKAAGADAWLVPDKVLELQHFATEPEDFSLGLTGEGEASILLTWESDSATGTRGQRFDLDGAALGDSFGIWDGHADDTSDTASLPDGRIVVVYTEQDNNGRVDIESHVVITGDDSQSGASGYDSQSGSSGSDGQSGASGSDSQSGTSGSEVSDHLFGDRSTLDAGLGDYGSLSSGSPLANDKDITMVEDATDGVIIDVLNDQADGGLRVVQVNGADLAIGAPLRIEHGFVQLRDDGDLLFTADEHFNGTVSFEYTVSTGDDQLATASVAINVTPVEDDPMPVDLALDHSGEQSSLPDASTVAYDGHDDGGSHSTATDTSGHADETPGYDGAQARDASGSGETELQQASGETGEAGHGEQEASLSGGGADTITLAPRYENAYRPGSIERQWLELNEAAGGHAAGAGYEGNQDAASHANDTFVFHAAFGNDAATPEARGLDHVIDLSKSGYPTFQALQDAGALVQVGEDVEITLNVTDPSHPEKILLRSVSLSTLTASDFKFG